jgi:hypothetical protein
LAAVLRVGSFCAFFQRNRFLLLCCVDGGAERRLDLGLLGTHGREKHTAKAVQFGAEITVLKSFSNSFRLVNRLKSIRGTMR